MKDDAMMFKTISARKILFPFSMSLCAVTASARSDDPLPITVDAAFLFDRSGSFGDDLDTFRGVADQLTDSLASRVTDLAVGVTSFVDAPCGNFGQSGDFGFQQNLNLTTDLAGLGRTLNSISVRNEAGKDTPESQLEAMQQALTGEGRIVNRGASSCHGVADIAESDLGWRKRTLKFLFVSTDSVFHKPTTADYPYPSDADSVIEAARAKEIRIYFLIAAGGSDEPDPDAYRIAEATGGEVRKLSADSRELPAMVEEIIQRDATEAALEN
jgi:hypothetical protein